MILNVPCRTIKHRQIWVWYFCVAFVGLPKSRFCVLRACCVVAIASSHKSNHNTKTTPTAPPLPFFPSFFKNHDIDNCSCSAQHRSISPQTRRDKRSLMVPTLKYSLVTNCRCFPYFNKLLAVLVTVSSATRPRRLWILQQTHQLYISTSFVTGTDMASLLLDSAPETWLSLVAILSGCNHLCGSSVHSLWCEQRTKLPSLHRMRSITPHGSR